MLDRAWSGAFRREIRKSPRANCRPQLESLEGRRLLNASLATLPNISVPDYLGYQVPLDGSGSNAPTQTFTVMSSNTDIKANVAQGQFLTLNVSHQAANANDVTFNGPITVQLFQDLTPTTYQKLVGFITSGFYNGKTFFRVANNFPIGDTNGYIVQGGSSTNTGSGSSGLPGTPFGNELVQQLAFTNPGQVALANTGQPNSNDTQFFFTTAAASNLDFNYTVFGQVVSGLDIVNQMTKVALTNNTATQPGGIDATPVSPITINSAALSNTDPNGVVHIDATQALAGETSTITVTATDPSTNTTATRSFQVTVAPNPTPPSNFNLQPSAFSITQPYTANAPQAIQLTGNNPNTGRTLSYAITSQPKDGTISQLDSTTGSLLYTPNQNFQGNDSFQFTVTDAGTGAPTTPNASKPATVTLTTTPGPLPVANPIVQSSTLGAPVSIQLSGNNESGSNQGIIYTITAQPTKGTISQLDATKGTLAYTPTTGASGTDTFQYIVTSTATGAHSLPATATINLQDPAVDTGEVRQIGNVLVVTPLPRTDKGTNNILVTQLNDPTNAANDKIQVLINNQLDIHQPLVSDLESNGNGRIVVFGSKASDTITVDPSVDSGLAVTLDGGHGGHNTLKAGAGPTREHGWFGRNTLIGGAGPNELVGRAGRVKFRPSSTTDEIFAGVARPNFRNGHIRPPGGTFYKFVNGKLIPTNAARTGSA